MHAVNLLERHGVSVFEAVSRLIQTRHLALLRVGDASHHGRQWLFSVVVHHFERRPEVVENHAKQHKSFVHPTQNYIPEKIIGYTFVSLFIWD